MDVSIIDYVFFLGMITALTVFDVMSHRKKETVSLKSALTFSGIYIFAAVIFSIYLGAAHGKEFSSLFITGYTLEKVLAFDNLFVFSMIFSYFKIAEKDQHSALHWGIAGAVIFRLIFVLVGVSFMHIFGRAIDFIFAGVIMYSVYAIIKSNDVETDYEELSYIKYIRRVYPAATPLLMAIIVIEISDILFSFDSVPAIIAVTKEPFLIYSSMIFAILGLRSMYFVISSLSRFLVFMDDAVIVVLSFISLKLLTGAIFGFHLSPLVSLIIILSILTAGVVLSLTTKAKA